MDPYEYARTAERENDEVMRIYVALHGLDEPGGPVESEIELADDSDGGKGHREEVPEEREERYHQRNKEQRGDMERNSIMREKEREGTNDAPDCCGEKVRRAGSMLPTRILSPSQAMGRDTSIMKRVVVLLVILLCLICLFSGGAFSADGWMVVDDFESGLSADWERKDFQGQTVYQVVQTDGGACLKAESHGSASGLIRKISYSLDDYPILSWRWKVDNILDRGDERSKEGDDYGARVYVVFPHWIPSMTRSINYIWANKLPQGEAVPNTYYKKAMMVAVESGNDQVGRWRQARRNVLEDYRRLFGDEPRKVGAIAIMTDTDNTGESATACYDDIRLEKGSSESVQQP